MMLRLLFSFVCLIMVYTVLGQEMTELERRNGFKSIKLGMVVDSLKGIKYKKDFKEKDEFMAKIYTLNNPEFEKIGEVKVDKIELKTYKSLVYQIHVVADKDPRLMKALESIYGQSEYDVKREIYFWRGNGIILKFKSYSKHQLEMIYTSFKVFNLMKEDKNKKVEDIADDF
jgi:hypothetical protein